MAFQGLQGVARQTLLIVIIDDPKNGCGPGTFISILFSVTFKTRVY